MKKNLKRREFLKKAGVAGAAAVGASTLAAPAIAGGHQEWIICSAFGKAGVLGQAIQAFGDNINSYSEKLKVKVYHAGELVPGLEALDAVRSGAAQAAYGAPYYWPNLSDAIEFVATCPFGMNAMEQNAWCYYGGGIEEADKIYNALGVKFLPMGNTGNQMGGWFNREINTPDDYKGLKMRMPGLGGRTIEKLGATPVLLAGGDILPALTSGAVDAAEWICPAADLGAGLYQAAKYGVKRRKELQEMSPEQKQELSRQSDEFSFGEAAGAAGGGLLKQAGDRSGKPPEAGPTPQGLDFLMKRGR